MFKIKVTHTFYKIRFLLCSLRSILFPRKCRLSRKSFRSKNKNNNSNIILLHEFKSHRKLSWSILPPPPLSHYNHRPRSFQLWADIKWNGFHKHPLVWIHISSLRQNDSFYSFSPIVGNFYLLVNICADIKKNKEF